ncbi:unnamed protein product [Amoebophrya sp. A25]|nr:unnamed protein product [Amoebophrya sp. A25]|eukprot:GSA25T00015757001.1
MITSHTFFDNYYLIVFVYVFYLDNMITNIFIHHATQTHLHCSIGNADGERKIIRAIRGSIAAVIGVRELSVTLLLGGGGFFVVPKFMKIAALVLLLLVEH